MKRVFSSIIAWCIIFSLAGCVTIFGRKKQKIKVTSVTEDAQIFIGENNKQNDTIKEVFQKDTKYAISARKNGYKTRHGIISAEKTTFLIYPDLALSPWMIGIFCLVVDGVASSKKMTRFKGSYEFPELVQLPQKQGNEKYIWVQDVIVNINEGDVLGKYYQSLGKMKRDKSVYEYKADGKMLYDVPLFKHDMNDILLSYGYSDTAENVIASSWNSLYLTSEIKTLETSVAGLKKSRKAGFFIDVDVQWVLYDGFGNRLYQTTTYGTSDLRLSSANFESSEFKTSVKDAIEYAMIELHNDPEFKELVQLDVNLATGGSNPLTSLDVNMLNSDNAIQLEQQIQSIVRLSAGDGLYSGTVLSNEGYIVTSYQAISSGDSVMVQIKGDWKPTKVVSTNAQLNLALLKVESDQLTPINWHQVAPPNVGEQVFALSFSSIEALDKYVASGVVSGFRTFQDKPFIQSDVPMSVGNSGGIMLNDKGHIIGILNAKANFDNVEGVGFTVPIEDVLKGLNIDLSM